VAIIENQSMKIIKKKDNYSISKESREGLSQLRYSQEQCSFQRVKLPQQWLKKTPKIPKCHSPIIIHLRQKVY